MLGSAGFLTAWSILLEFKTGSTILWHEIILRTQYKFSLFVSILTFMKNLVHNLLYLSQQVSSPLDQYSWNSKPVRRSFDMKSFTIYSINYPCLYRYLHLLRTWFIIYYTWISRFPHRLINTGTPGIQNRFVLVALSLAKKTVQSFF
jgi:hypothetical protein